MTRGENSYLYLTAAAHSLRNAGVSNPIPARIWLALSGIANDGDSENEVKSLLLQRHAHESVSVTLQREWDDLKKTATIRRNASKLLLRRLISLVPEGARGKELLVKTTLGDLYSELNRDTILPGQVRDIHRLADRALMWLHEHEIVRLNQGLTVFRHAMTMHLEPDKRDFLRADFAPLEFHYTGQTLQIHVMSEYAKIAIEDQRRAIQLADDYFQLKQDIFVDRWMQGKFREIARETTPESWKRIVEDLNNRIQQNIVTDSRVTTNVLVLAGPGSGKTRVLVHRIAYLIRVKRENPHSILALAYNRHAAVEIRRRLKDLIGDDVIGIMVLTCHSLAMRLAGFSFANRSDNPDEETFKAILQEATKLLQGEGLPPEDASDQRERLLLGFRWILTDEYQDIGREEYELISALAGRTHPDADGKLTLFAVGDDDQNIYGFRGTSIEYIRRFEQDYRARITYLPENYRSTKYIVDASNAVIERANDRMKTTEPIRVDRDRISDPPGGAWGSLDPVGNGRVQLVSAPDTFSQARIAVAELQRLQKLAPSNFDWSRSAIIACRWEYLEPLRVICDTQSIQVQLASDDLPRFWQLRETQRLLDFLSRLDHPTIRAAEVLDWLTRQPENPWNDLLTEVLEGYHVETDGADNPVSFFTEWLAEVLRDFRQKQQGLLLLSAHKAKGLEFDHVVILDGRWDTEGRYTDDCRRLYYVAMTRAKETLTLMHVPNGNPYCNELISQGHLLRRTVADLDPPSKEIQAKHQQLTLGDVDLDFAGRFAPTHPIHRAISKLQAGDLLFPSKAHLDEGNHIERFTDNASIEVLRLSKHYDWPHGMRLREASVFAVVARRKDWSDPEYVPLLKNEHWEVIIPRFVFEPSNIDLRH